MSARPNDDSNVALLRGPTRIVFLRLDPVLKALLENVTALKTVFDDNGTVSSSETGSAQWFRLVDVIVQHLDDLDKQLRFFRGTLPSPELGASLILIKDYVTLPLTAIFHLQLPQKLLAQIIRSMASIDTNENPHNDPSEQQRRLQIQQSYLRKLIAAASKAIQSYVEACSVPSGASATRLDDAYFIKYLISLVSCLPSSAQVEELFAGSSDIATFPPKSNLLLWQPTAYMPLALDDGSELWVTSLNTIQFVLQNYNNSWQTLLNAWHGTLLMRLVDSTTGFLLWRQQQPDKQYGATTGRSDFIFSSPVQKAAVDLLGVMLQESATAVATSSDNENKTALTSFWQSVFPGVFTPLYRHIMGTSGIMASSSTLHQDRCIPKLECRSIECVVFLLRITLAQFSNDIDSPESDSISATNIVLQQLSSLVLNSNRNDDKKTKISSPSQDKEHPRHVDAFFLQQVQKLVVAPLSVILRQKAVSKSGLCRKATISLCRVILIETRSSWTTSTNENNGISVLMEDGSISSNAMKHVALEICMALRQDSQEEIASQARTVFNEYTAEASRDEQHQDSSWMVSRIMGLVERMPAILMGSGKQVELRLELQKVIGYMECCNGRGLGSALINSVAFQEALIQIMDIDLETLDCKENCALILNDQDASAVGFRWLDSDLVSLAKEMLRGLGRSQSPKCVALFVDAAISDFFEENQNIPSMKQLGSLVVIQELIKGAFSTTQKESEARILQSMAGSVVRLITSSNLWNLPTSENKATCTTSTQILKRNSCAVVLLLELLNRTFFHLLSQKTLKDFIPVALYPVVEKASPNESKAVQEAAKQALLVLATSLGRTNIDDLICSEQNRLIAVMWGRLRLPCGMVTPGQYEVGDILKVAGSLQWILDSISRANSDTKTRNHGNALRGKSGITDLVSLVEYRLNHLTHQKLLCDNDFGLLCSLRKSFFCYFLSVFNTQAEMAYSYKSHEMETSHNMPWIDVLYQFQKISSDIGLHKRTTIHKAEEQDPSTYLDISQQDIDLFTRLIARNCYLLSYPTLKIRVSACQGLTWGFRFLAFVGNVHKDTKDEQSVIQNSILRQVSDSWPAIKARLLTLSEEIQAAGREASSVSLVVRSHEMSVPAPTDANQVPFRRIFLANIFNLVAFLCECSGDFMADRFRNFVFPVIATQLRCLLQRQKIKQEQLRLVQNHHSASSRSLMLLQSKTSRSFPAPPSPDPLDKKITTFDWSDTERQLVMAMLRCLTRAFQQKDCGLALQSILGLAGNLILPLLEIGNDTDIEGATMECLKSILQIDCDILWRPLLDFSGSSIPPCPLRIHSAPTSHPSNAEKSTCVNTPHSRTSLDGHNSLMTVRCCELIFFAESLSEQRII